MISHLTRIRYRRVVALPAPARASPPKLAGSPEGCSLLTQILLETSNVERPIVQFIASCADATNCDVPRQFAVAAVERLGRTLLISAKKSSASSNVDAASARLAKLLGCDSEPVTPDVSVPGLYHRCLNEASIDDSDARLDADQSALAGYRMIVLQCRPIAGSVATLRYASEATASVLMVASGKTRLDMIQTSTRQITRAGGRVVGAVLFDAPCPPWGEQTWRA